MLYYTLPLPEKDLLASMLKTLFIRSRVADAFADWCLRRCDTNFTAERMASDMVRNVETFEFGCTALEISAFRNQLLDFIRQAYPMHPSYSHVLLDALLRHFEKNPLPSTSESLLGAVHA